MFGPVMLFVFVAIVFWYIWMNNDGNNYGF